MIGVGGIGTVDDVMEFLLAGAAAHTVCRVQELLRCADHVLVVGAPVWQSVDPAREPLLLHRGGPRRIVG